MVGLTLMITGIVQVLQAQSLGQHFLSDGYGIVADTNGAGKYRADLKTILLTILRAVLFGRMTSYGMGYLMTKHNSQ